MSEPKFTPGPWRPSFSVIMHEYAVYTKANEQIAGVYGTAASGRAADEAKANACLIAAAPDLYEALSEFIDAGKRLHAGDAMNAVEKAERALAKARGES